MSSRPKLSSDPKDNLFLPTAAWRPDVNGKADYDGVTIQFYSRFYPAWKNADGKPSAVSEFVLCHGFPDSDYQGQKLVLATKDFKGETDQEVKDAVQRWVTETHTCIIGLVWGHIKPPKFRGKKPKQFAPVEEITRDVG